MTEVREFASWDAGNLQVRRWVPFDDYERLDADAAGERAECESWRLLAADREAVIQSLRQEIERLRAELARLQSGCP
jgi:hypothetical protein